MGEIIGRLKELKTLRQLQMSDKSEFVALYGRRRVGKTFLVRTVCEDKFTFQVTGIANVTLQQQLGNFHSALQRMNATVPNKIPTNWFKAFEQLILCLEKDKTPRKVIFMDELT